MARVEIVHWPNPVLSRGTKPVERIDDDFKDTVERMKRLMVDLRGVGLAAPQVGIASRFMIVCPAGEIEDARVVVNPEILSSEGTEDMEEGCLSFPGVYGIVRRATKIHVRYRDLDLAEKDLVLEGFVARIFQHEFDHLNGVVFVDRMEPTERTKNRKRLDELKKAAAPAPSA
jgi:peptide deformylase